MPAKVGILVLRSGRVRDSCVPTFVGTDAGTVQRLPPRLSVQLANRLTLVGEDRSQMPTELPPQNENGLIVQRNIQRDTVLDFVGMDPGNPTRKYADWLPSSVGVQAFLESTKLPYIPYFSFGEKLPVLEQGTTDPAGLGHAYESLTAMIAHRCEAVDLLLHNRSDYIQAVAERASEAVASKQGPVSSRASAVDSESRLGITGHIIRTYRVFGKWGEENYQAALGRYLSWVCASTGKVFLRGLKRGGQQAVELPLDEVYVPLAAEALPENHAELKLELRRGSKPTDMNAIQRISTRELMAQGNHLAVIGAPGCGKTTVLQYIAWTLAEALRTRRPELAAERLGFEQRATLASLRAAEPIR